MGLVGGFQLFSQGNLSAFGSPSLMKVFSILFPVIAYVFLLLYTMIILYIRFVNTVVLN
jgi:hypothetical protein